LAPGASFTRVAPRAHPSPLTLRLDSGQVCQIRDGGAWDGVQPHPTWVGWYSCIGGVNVYGPRSGDGIFRDGSDWVVYTSAGDSPAATAANRAPIHQHRVVAAYFVGTAG